MSRRVLVAALGAALTLAAAGIPGLAPPTSAASCSSWSSESDPPPTIRVFRHESGAVETVDFRTYAKNVLSREWIGSWTTESLRSGALAVKSYAWYQVLHWRGYGTADGTCFDVFDDTRDQVYDPGRTTWSTAAAAVDATWGTRVLKNGRIFPTYYNAGDPGEACGAHANGWKAYQWGTQACGLDGRSAAQIMLTYYYPGVTVTDAPGATATPAPTPPPSTPTPTPAATATPSATPTPQASASPGASTSPAPTASAPPVATPTPVATATPTPVPTPTATPLPTPPPVQELPGGGQAEVEGASAPPPPPPPNPVPVIATPVPQPARLAVDSQLGAWEYSGWAMHRVLEFADPPGPSFTSGATSRGDVRLATFRLLWRAAVRDLFQELVTAWMGREPTLAHP